jgi:hypothetical protein
MVRPQRSSVKGSEPRRSRQACPRSKRCAKPPRRNLKTCASTLTAGRYLAPGKGQAFPDHVDPPCPRPVDPPCPRPGGTSRAAPPTSPDPLWGATSVRGRVTAVMPALQDRLPWPRFGESSASTSSKGWSTSTATRPDRTPQPIQATARPTEATSTDPTVHRPPTPIRIAADHLAGEPAGTGHLDCVATLTAVIAARTLCTPHGPTRRRRVDAGLVQDLPYRAGGDLVAEADQFAVHPAMPQEGFSTAKHSTRSRIC